jgi:hypothetical protein
VRSVTSKEEDRKHKLCFPPQAAAVSAAPCLLLLLWSSDGVVKAPDDRTTELPSHQTTIITSYLYHPFLSSFLSFSTLLNSTRNPRL